jgi:hypothetical protein
LIPAQSENIGLAAEFLVCHDLAAKGFRTCLSPFDKAPYDVLCEYNNKFLRVQVKGTAKLNVRSNKSSKSYRFNLRCNPEDFDLLALVAVDRKTILYMSPQEIIGRSHGIEISHKRFTETNDKVVHETLKNFGKI